MNLRAEEPITGSILIALAHVPFAWEVALQLRLQAKLFKLLPSALHHAPGAPLHGNRIIFAPARFQKAMYDYVWSDDPTDVPEAQAIKRRLRRSWRRKLGFAVGGLAAIVVLLYRGWRPW